MQPPTTTLGPLLPHFFVASLGTQTRASPQTIARSCDTLHARSPPGLHIIRDGKLVTPMQVFEHEHQRRA